MFLNRKGEIDQQQEANLWEAVQKNDLSAVQGFRENSEFSFCDTPFMQAVIGEAISYGNQEMVTAVVDLFAYNNQQSHKVCHYIIIERKPSLNCIVLT